MPKEKILVVEDDRNISKLIKYNLEKEGYEVIVSITGEEALEILQKQYIDLIILDIMLPKMDGFEVTRFIKQNNDLKGIPIIILTAKSQEIDRVVGFELGADDYIVKPFSVREFILRIKAILKRGVKVDIANTKKDILTRENLCINLPKHKVTLNDKIITLTAMEFKLLVVLMDRVGRVQTREQLLSSVWNIEADVTTRTIDTHIKRLRKKLGKAGSLIETVRGLGYKFKEED
ncbi:MAG: response regulator transcription factor [Candidatus Omnitrophota bacterium]